MPEPAPKLIVRTPPTCDKRTSRLSFLMMGRAEHDLPKADFQTLTLYSSEPIEPGAGSAWSQASSETGIDSAAYLGRDVA